MGFNLYVKGKYKKMMEELKVICESDDKSFSAEICKAVKFYQDNKDLIRPDDREIWENFIDQADEDELLDLSTFICEMNERITKKCQS